MIPCANPHAQFLLHQEEINEAIQRVLDSGSYILGQEVESFEKEYASYCQVKNAVSVASGTDALFLALKAFGISQGDEVITVSHTAVATVSAIKMTGATPVLVDIEPDYHTLDPELFSSAITKQTKAVIPVHIYGQPANLNEICNIAKKNGIYVIEDCAQAHGAEYQENKVGSFGDAACFSFYPTKNLGCIGDGGIIISNNTDFINKVRLLREYGWAERYISHIHGYNSRLDTLQAAILRVKLKYLDRDNDRRINISKIYKDNLILSSIEHPNVRDQCRHVYHLYVIQTPERDPLKEYLHQNGVGTGIHYPSPVHLQPAYQSNQNTLNLTETLSKRILSLPIYPGMSEANAFEVVKHIKNYYSKN